MRGHNMSNNISNTSTLPALTVILCTSLVCILYQDLLDSIWMWIKSKSDSYSVFIDYLQINSSTVQRY